MREEKESVWDRIKNCIGILLLLACMVAGMCVGGVVMGYVFVLLPYLVGVLIPIGIVIGIYRWIKDKRPKTQKAFEIEVINILQGHYRFILQRWRGLNNKTPSL